MGEGRFEVPLKDFYLGPVTKSEWTEACDLKTEAFRTARRNNSTLLADLSVQFPNQKPGRTASMILTASNVGALVKLAHSLPRGDENRRVLLTLLKSSI